MKNPGRRVHHVGGEFVIKRRLGSERDHDSAGARHGEQARLEQVMVHRRVGLAWRRRASGARYARCSNPGIRTACASGRRQQAPNITVVRKYCVSCKCSSSCMMIRRRPARASTHDAVRPTLTSRARSCPPATDVGTLTSEPPMLPPADPVRLDPTSCAASPRCSASPIRAALHANVSRKLELSSRDIPAESYRSPAHRSNSPWGFETASAVPSTPTLELSCQSA